MIDWGYRTTRRHVIRAQPLIEPQPPVDRSINQSITGPECRVCTADGVCGSGQACRKALPMYKELRGACSVGTKGFADFLGGAGSVMLTMGMPGAFWVVVVGVRVRFWIGYV
jgi:hypothetical protein